MTTTRSQTPLPHRPQTGTARRTSHPRQLRAHASPSAGGRLFRPKPPQHPRRHPVAAVDVRGRARPQASHQIPRVSSRASPARLPIQTRPQLLRLQRRVDEVAQRRVPSRKKASSPRQAFNQVLSPSTSQTRTPSRLPRMPSPTRLPWMSTRSKLPSRSPGANERVLRRQHLRQRRPRHPIYHSLNHPLRPGSRSHLRPQIRTGSRRHYQTSLILLGMISGGP